MVTFLLKKSYQLNNLKEVPFKDLWGSKGVFTTMRMIGKPPRLILLKPHLDNLLQSTKKYKIRRKNLENIIKNLIKKNCIYKGPDNLFRIALNKKLISLSIRKRPKPNKNFRLLLLKHRRTDPNYKNLYYKRIIAKLSKINSTKFDVALIFNKKILETGTSNLVFVKNKKIYSPKNNCYLGNTIKFINKKIKIQSKDISINEIKNFDEIILIGSGKGVTSVSAIDSIGWKRKSSKIYKNLLKIYNTHL